LTGFVFHWFFAEKLFHILKSKKTNYMKKIKIIIPAIMLLAACSKDMNEINPGSTAQAALSSNSNAQKTAVTRPFSATFNAAADANASPTSCSGVVPFAAPDFLLSGTATYLGIINAQISRLHHVSCDVDVATMLLSTNVTVDLFAANGDIVHCSGADVVNVVNLLTQTGTTGAITGAWTVTGGTGRFTGASGSITINGLVDFVTNSFTCVCTGSITY
jgi:hypothetical protein